MISIRNQNDRQAALNRLYSKSINELKATLQKLMAKKKYNSIIDIGCGYFPYLEGCFDSTVHCEKITLLDRDPNLIERLEATTKYTFENASSAPELIKLVGPEHDFSLFINDEYGINQNKPFPEKSQGYDVVILSATLHELNLQDAFSCTTATGQKIDKPFLQRLMRALRRMLNPGGTLVLAEFYYPSYLTTSEKCFMAAVQEEMLGHGDPPKAFFSPSEIIVEARSEGLSLIQLHETEPLKEADDETILSQLTINHSINKCAKELPPEIFDKIKNSKSDNEIGKWYKKRYSEEYNKTKEILLDYLNNFELSGIDKENSLKYIGNLLRERGHFIATFTANQEARKPNKEENVYRDLHNPRRELMALISQSELSIVEFLNKQRVKEKLENIVRRPGIGSDEARAEVRNLYQSVLGDEDGLFHRLARNSAEMSIRWSSSIGFRIPRYLAIWLSHNSRLLAEKSYESARFNAVYEEPVDGTKTSQYRCYHTIPSETSEYKSRDRDWSSIAFNCLLIPDGVDVGNDRWIKGPSVHEWLRRSSKKPQTWRRSVSIWYSPSCKEEAGNFRSNSRDTEAEISALQFIRRNLRTKTRSVDSEHAPVHVEFRIPLDRPGESYFCGRALNAFLSDPSASAEDDLKGDEGRNNGVPFCSAPDWALEERDALAYQKMQEGLASLFYDFIFLSRFVPDGAELFEKRKALKRALVSFGDRWLNSRSVRFCSWDDDGTLAVKPSSSVSDETCRDQRSASEVVRDDNLVLLPDKMRVQITAAIKQARDLLRHAFYETLDPSVLPMAMVTITLADAGVAAEARSLMYFSDTLLDHEWIELSAQLAEKPFAYIGNIEKTIIAEQSATKTAKREQLQAILSNIGHDGKHLATTIKVIIDTGWKGASAVASTFAASLGGRMSCYSRFAVVSQKKTFSIIEELKFDIAEMISSITVQEVFFGEIEAIVARDLAYKPGSKKNNELFERLFHMTTRDQFVEALRGYGVDINCGGPSFELPSSVRQSDPLLIACLRLIFSELVRNAIRHDWGGALIPSTQHRPREIGLTVSVEEKQRSLELPREEFLRFQIEHSAGRKPRLNEESGCVGLLSVMAALRACAGVYNTDEPIKSGGSHNVLFPDFENGTARSSFSIPLAGFKTDGR